MTATLFAHHRRMVAYDLWAIDATLASLRSCDGAAPRGAVRLLAHIIGAERLWLARIGGEKPPVAVWPEWSLAECVPHAAALAPLWSGLFDRLDDPRLAEPVAYTNSKGEPWTSTIGDIIAHVVAHSSYHRGQIASELRAAGRTPAYTDYIHAVRAGFLGEG